MVKDLEEIVNNLLLNKKYSDDYELIKETYKLIQLLNEEEKVTNDILNKIDINIEKLNSKYVDLFELTNVYDPLKIKFEKILHNKYVGNLRNENRKRRSNKC